MLSKNDLKLRIKSIKSTKKLTSAMKMIAASKLKRARDASEAILPYARKLDQIVTNLSVGELEDNIPLLNGKDSTNAHLIIIISSDRGLCGGFNSSIIKEAKNEITNLILQGNQVKLYLVGKKAYDLLKNLYGDNIIKRLDNNIKIANQIAEEVAGDIVNLIDEFDQCKIYYSEFKTILSQEAASKTLIPFIAEVTEGEHRDLYEYEPSKLSILNSLLPMNLRTQIYKIILDTATSEQGARMNAMDNASKNADDMIGKLNLIYNRTRQELITNELIEIISGAEAISS